MMTKNTSKSLALLKKVAIAPILVGMIYFFCVEIVAQEKVINPIEKKSKNTETGKDKIRDRYYSNVRVILKDLRTNTTIDKMYEELSLEEKRTFLSWVPNMKIEKEIPTPLFEKMKTKNMAVWINGKVSSKEEIQKYKRTDFSYYTYSFVHKNAKSKRFPQEYQYTLYTKKYFDENLKNSHLHFSNDTLKMTISDIKKDKVSQILTQGKADTIVWFTKGKEEYNLYVNDTIKKAKNAVVGKEANLTEPNFPGGISEFYNYFAKNFKMPEKFKSKDKIFASFIIEKDGSLSNIEIKKDLGFGTKEETIRILENSPKWIPATKDNKKIRYQYVLPILISSE